ncbi:PepSY domain-containing protein [Poseidonocella sp. HB161398]|uniref:PepSY-associated TM helix domain-containing protein n=1 Tax=Poseidonocella sp. HB161398 TaxID=2320855 RepID=UPI0014872BAA|nr:PepSY-associated TM helix domain-containing protein [Poseidonocella sp. HB161398]
MLRTILFWAHFAAGAVAGLFIFLMSATGLILSYEAQITEAAVRSAVEAPAGAEPLDADALIAKLALDGSGAGRTLVLDADPAVPPELRAGRSSVRLDPYTGEVLEEAGAGTAAFFRKVTYLHRWLSLSGPSDTGGAINGAANLVFVFLAASGLYLWLPRVMRWSQFRIRLLLRRGLPTAQARHFSWHHVFGAWALVPLFVIALSGVVISYPWASRLVYAAYGETAPAGRGGPGGGALPGDLAGEALTEDRALPASALLAAAGTLAPGWKTAAIALPEDGARYVTVAMDRGNGRQAAKRETLILDRATGAALGHSGIEAQSPASRARGWFRFVHTGEVYGLAGQTIGAAACLAAMVLVYTGLSLGLRRLGRMRRKAAAGRAAA